MGTHSAGSKRVGRLIPTFADNYIESEHVDESHHFERSLSGGVELYYLRINSPQHEEIFGNRIGSNFDNRANRSFFARLYKPPSTTADHVVIIYNGLDETIFNQEPDELFKFYDDLGVQLAQANILAILLPTPYHMNRALAFTDAEKEGKRREDSNFIDFTIPTEALMEHNWNIYRNHFQGFKETLELCRRLRPDLSDRAWPDLKPYPNAIPSKAARFLQSSVSPLVKISLLGYSLGGLRALTEYLFDRHDAKVRKREPIFTACVAVNSGGALTDLPHPPWVDSQRWRSMIEDLLGQRFAEDRSQKTLKVVPKDQHTQAGRYFTFLNDVFLGQAASLNFLGETAAREAANGMLFVVGGGDNLVPLRSIQRFAPVGGVTIFQVAGMGHLFPYDPAWLLWKGVELDVVAKFLGNTARSRAARSDYDSLAGLISFLDHKLSLLPYQSNIEKPEVFRKVKEKIAQTTDASVLTLGDAIQRIIATTGLDNGEIELQFQAYIESLIERLHLEVRRGVVHPGLYKRRRRSLLLGRFLTGGHTALQDAWEGIRREGDEKIGEALVRLGVVRQADRDTALAEQKRALGAILELMVQDFLNYVRDEQPRPIREMAAASFY
jgi:hypothetical protein